MSAGINLAAGIASNVVGSVLGEIEFALIATGFRAIDFIVPDCAIEEAHQDVSVITEFPVEVGAAITDHTYERPPGLIMRVGFSDCGQAPGYVQAVYQRFLALKASRRPFSVFTGKRAYDDMLIAALDTVTDERSETALYLTVAMRAIILTNTGDSAGKTSLANQAMPAATGGVEQTGPKQAIPLPPGASGALSSLPVAPSGGLTGLSVPPSWIGSVNMTAPFIPGTGPVSFPGL